MDPFQSEKADLIGCIMASLDGGYETAGNDCMPGQHEILSFDWPISQGDNDRIMRAKQL